MKNFEKSLIIDVRSTSGFFSNYLLFVDNLRYCSLNDIKPIFRLESYWFYNDGRPNLWESFFKPINDGVVEGTTERSDFFKLWDKDFLVRNGKVMVWENIDNPSILEKNRHEVSEVVNLIKPIKEIESIVNEFEDKNFRNKKVLGVHIRGTDYEFYNLDRYVEKIQKYEKDFDLIYVASDNQESIDFIKNSFDNVVFYETPIRTKKISDKVLCFNLPNDQKVSHGRDVYIECLLLSKCEHLICINSNVSAVSLYMNPKMTFDLITRVPQGG